MKRAAGEATTRVETDAALQAIADVFWFSLEFGVLWEDGELRAYGAGILSSYGEIEEFRSMEIRPLDIAEMTTVDYDITSYQPVLFGAASFGELEEVVGGFFAIGRRRHARAPRHRARCLGTNSRAPRKGERLRGIARHSGGPTIEDCLWSMRASVALLEQARTVELAHPWGLVR